MKRGKSSAERRKHPRFFPDKENMPEVNFIFDDGEKISIDVVNISRGGMLASTSHMEIFLEMEHQKIKTIEIIAPDRQPFRCSGILLRVHPLLEDKKCYCAIEFSRFGEQTGIALAGEEIRKQNQKKERKNFESSILERVREAENYTKMIDHESSPEIRKNVYDSFSDIADKLSVEDRWWFFELLDEMKSREPSCPEDLKKDFLELCLTVFDKESKSKNGSGLGIVRK